MSRYRKALWYLHLLAYGRDTADTLWRMDVVLLRMDNIRRGFAARKR